ncbi:MAG: response regulator transcription factor [Beijerinckiaceae bacterium]|nr:response regulator transcription factor [Beijerinckiaceae bacterium]
MKILIVDDHSVVREGVRRLLGVFVEAAVLEAGTGKEALTLFRTERPDIVVLDLNLPGAGGLDLLKRLLAEDPRARVLIFSMHTTPVYIARALQSGAKGYVSKGASADELVEAIRKVVAGERYVERDLAAELALHTLGPSEPNKALSARELDIMRLLAQGKDLTSIADQLGISYKTVANSCTGIKQKLMVERSSDLIRIAVELHAE